MELADQEALGQRILDVPHQRALERSRTVLRIVAAVAQPGAGLGRELDVQTAVSQQVPQARKLEVDDAVDLVPPQAMEEDDVVDPVQELGPEPTAQLRH